MEILQIKSTSEMNVFNGLISRLNTAKEIIFKFEDNSMEITQTERKRRKGMKKK